MSKTKKIGEVAKELSVNADTLRYYEKIKLLGRVKRSENGIRLYSQEDIGRVIFIKQAQKVGFSLEEIAQLLTFRDNPIQSKSKVRELVAKKLEVIEQRIDELSALRDEFSQLTEQCIHSEGGCPILKKFESKKLEIVY
jgi:DNA-binding transcriptional MerR regulator